MYCFSCDEILCLECEKNHKSHLISNISKANEEIKENLKKLIESMDLRSKDILKLTKDLEEKKKRNDEVCDKNFILTTKLGL